VSPPGHVNQIFLSLGSNIEPEQHLQQVLQELAQLGSVRAVSSVYESSALGRADQPPYLNAVVHLEAEVDARDLICRLIPELEGRLGRVRTADKYAPRPIDIDLLLFNEEVLEVAGHSIPSPEIRERSFVAWPLAEIAPTRVHPLEGRTFREIASAFDPRALTRRPDIQLTAGRLGAESGSEGRLR